MREGRGLFHKTEKQTLKRWEEKGKILFLGKLGDSTKKRYRKRACCKKGKERRLGCCTKLPHPWRGGQFHIKPSRQKPAEPIDGSLRLTEETCCGTPQLVNKKLSKLKRGELEH